jgi:TonB family protein
LVVYQDGKMVFPQTPPVGDARAQKSTTATETTAAEVKPAVETTKVPVVSAAGPVRIPAEVAAELVTQRVEPEYPQAAREERIQGAVMLDAVVGKDGVVEKFTAIRGDPQLAAAASTAVRQWRFKPYQSGGKPEAFQTSITVVFRLP